MKLAYIGKGGSGKSTVSWLATQTLAAQGRRVLGIDADHNMDFIAILGKTIDVDTPTMHRRADAFRAAVGQKEDKRWHEIVLDDRELPTFTLTPKDSYTAQITLPVSDAVDAIAVGLGADDVLFSDRCAHGHSASLKFYLPLLDEGTDTDVIIDGVAGVDMMNFGLFLGTDGIVVVVEPHPNSMRVLAQIAQIADRTNLPLYVVVNKVQEAPSPYWDEIEKAWGNRIVGRIPADLALAAYNYDALKPETILAAKTMMQTLREKTHGGSDSLARLRAFEKEKAAGRGM